ncbi:unnamed protein product [Symbiodinium sp. CCMP2592]|nr:unnamed protein product [Symbiodinium sp. CCMP2592]
MPKPSMPSCEWRSKARCRARGHGRPTNQALWLRSGISLESLILMVMILIQVGSGGVLLRPEPACVLLFQKDFACDNLPKATAKVGKAMGKIMHAKFGECPEVRRSSPKGGQHPNVRWKWPEVPKPRVIVELGGNRGEDLQAFLTLYPHAHIHSFEPVKSHYDYLLQKFSAPISEGRVKIYNLGASDADAKVTFRTDGDISASSACPVAGASMPARRPIDVFSVNCEGCEYAVLERLRDTGWFSKIKVLQVSWHVSSSIPRRVGRRCRLAKDLPGTHFRLARIADFGWTIFVARPRPYALEESFRGNQTPAQISHSNGLPQAAAGIHCPSGRSAERVGEDPGVTIHSDPDAAHWTYPQTMDQEAALQVFKGQALALPAKGVKPVIFKVGQSWGDTWLGTMAANPSAVIYSFEPVQHLKLLQDTGVWGTQPSGLDNWNGTLEDVELRDADGVFSEIRRDHGRSADLLYLNCGILGGPAPLT